MVSIIYRDYSIVTPDAFSTGIGQRKMVSIEITQFSLGMHSPLGLDKERWYLYSIECSIVTPDAFSTGIGQRKMVSIEITQFSLWMHSLLGLDKERWYL